MDSQEKDGALGAIALEEEEDHGGIEGLGTKPKTIKGRR